MARKIEVRYEIDEDKCEELDIWAAQRGLTRGAASRLMTLQFLAGPQNKEDK